MSSAKVKEFLNSPIRMLIDGEWVAARSGQTFDTHDPATGEVLAAVPLGRAEDIDLAVAAARRVFDAGEWSAMRPNTREKLIWRIADLMDSYAEDPGELESLDNGKSVGVATAVDVRFAAECFRYYAGWPTKLTGTTNNPSMLLADPAQGVPRLHAPGARRRLRTDHPVELPHPHGGPEDRPGPGHGEHGRPQAC
ncbi:aldehyde dehydrogenase family protein [Janibacter limosus]|uniref:aldehyde dehydrogenase family protein n=1 Tax=Janibacter limosus TaxID=53458 RepID=UPI002342BE4C|nr:aldehyde dehydrogenase family protein [Janibacter limosus]WKV16683.1 aldehyde dehydrogenase family protein [Janibacter limosus]